MNADDNAAHSGIRNEDVRTSTQDAQRQTRISCNRNHLAQSLAPVDVDEPIGGAADFERGQRRKRRVAAHVAAAECIDEASARGHARACSAKLALRSLSASSASSRVHSWNSIQSPGAS